jgi:hypothetical protein
MPLATSGLTVGIANKMEPLSVLTNGSAEASFESKAPPKLSVSFFSTSYKGN